MARVQGMVTTEPKTSAPRAHVGGKLPYPQRGNARDLRAAARGPGARALAGGMLLLVLLDTAARFVGRMY